MTNKEILEKLNHDFSGHLIEMSGDGLLKVDGDVAYIKWETAPDIQLSKSADDAFYNLIKDEILKYFENKSKK